MIHGIIITIILSGATTTAGTGLMELLGAQVGITLGGECTIHGLQAGAGTLAGAGILGIMDTAGAGITAGAGTLGTTEDTATDMAGAGTIGDQDRADGMTVTMLEEMAQMNTTATETAAAVALELTEIMPAETGQLEALTEKTLRWESSEAITAEL